MQVKRRSARSLDFPVHAAVQHDAHRRRAGRAGRAFTIIELMVVITVIILILALAVPGLSAMNAEARLTGASQTINASLTRAYYLAMADMNMTAVRFLPAEWDSEFDAAKEKTGRQHLVIYSYKGVTYDPDNPRKGVQYDEYMIRRPGATSVTLPEDVWAAPILALSGERMNVRRIVPGDTLDATYSPIGPNFVLDGPIGRFAYDPVAVNGGSDSDSDFLTADDFFIAVDPQQGVLGVKPEPIRVRAMAQMPNGDWKESDRDGNLYYQRHSFTGVVLYRREPFATLGTDAPGRLRQDFLKANGRPFMAQRYGAGLTPGLTRPE